MLGPYIKAFRPEGRFAPASVDFLDVPLRFHFAKFMSKIKNKFSKPVESTYYKVEEADHLFDSFRDRLSDAECLSDPNVATMEIFDSMWDHFKELVYQINRYRQAMYFHQRFIAQVTVDDETFPGQYTAVIEAVQKRALEAFKPFVTCLEASMSMEFGDLNSDYQAVEKITQKMHDAFEKVPGAMEESAFYKVAINRSKLWISNANARFNNFLDSINELDDFGKQAEGSYDTLFRTFVDQAVEVEFTNFSGLLARITELMEIKATAPGQYDSFF